MAVDPAQLDPELLRLDNLVHLQQKAEDVCGGGELEEAGHRLLGGRWRNQYRYYIRIYM